MITQSLQSLNRIQLFFLTVLGVNRDALSQAPHDASGLINRGVLLFSSFSLYVLLHWQAFAFLLGSQGLGFAIGLLTATIVIYTNREFVRYELFEIGKLEVAKEQDQSKYRRLCRRFFLLMTCRTLIALALSLATLSISSLALTRFEANTVLAQAQQEYEAPCASEVKAYRVKLEQQMAQDQAYFKTELHTYKQNTPAVDNGASIASKISGLSNRQARLVSLIEELDQNIFEEIAGRSSSRLGDIYLTGRQGCGPRCATLQREKQRLANELSQVQSSLENAREELSSVQIAAADAQKHYRASAPIYGGLTDAQIQELVAHREATAMKKCERPFAAAGLIRMLTAMDIVYRDLSDFVKSRILALFGLIFLLEVALICVGGFTRVSGYSRAVFLKGED